MPTQTTAAVARRSPPTPLGRSADHCQVRLAARGDITTIMILAMMRSTLMQHLDIVPELRGVGSDCDEKSDRC